MLKEPGQLWNIQQNSHNSLPLNPQPRRFKEVSSCHSSSNLHVTGVECNFCGTFALDVTYPYEALTAATCCKCMAHRKRHTRRPWRRVLLQSCGHHCLVQESSTSRPGTFKHMQVTWRTKMLNMVGEKQACRPQHEIRFVLDKS